MPNGCGQRRSSGGQRFWWVLQDVAVVLLGQELSRRLADSSSRRVVAAAWLIFCYVVVSVYIGNLTASLTLPKPSPRAETLAQMEAATDRFVRCWAFCRDPYTPQCYACQCCYEGFSHCLMFCQVLFSTPLLLLMTVPSKTMLFLTLLNLASLRGVLMSNNKRSLKRL